MHSMTVQTSATAEVIPTLRTIGADLAMRLDFDLDAIDDLRMAVDEACSLLLPAASDGLLDCAFRYGAGRIELSVSVFTEQPDLVVQDALGWQLLNALVSSVDRSMDQVDGGFRAKVDLARDSATVAR
ncbi:serine/threonine-protein kinase RsbW [Amycolatopsis marina]|uniref:Serine/threonine-protein kinase RsbW n=2 Tax=Amycolatopsis marina TaxID=490629 RepID=A0A1I0WRV4_9PSEU|nr:serine/threonine-protein kinase RsbW [Amycolatopsis marina]